MIYLLVSKGTNCVNLFHPTRILASTAASASPPTLSMSPKWQNISTNSGFALAPISTLVRPALVTGFKQPLEVNDFCFWHYPLIITLVLFIFTLVPLFSTLSFHSFSLLIKSSSISAITTKSSAYNSSHGKATYPNCVQRSTE